MKFLHILLCFIHLHSSFVYSSDEEVKPLLLFEATDEGNKDVTKWLLSHGADINVRNSDGKTPLMRTVERNNDTDMTEFMVSQHADLDIEDKEGRTALLIAAALGKTSHFEYLMGKNAKYNVRDKRGRTVMHIAADNGQCSILKKVDDKFTDIVNSTDHWGRSPIWYAAYRGNFECYTILKKYGSDLTSSDLIAAVNGGNLAIVNSLLESVNDVEVRNASGMSLVQIACDARHSDVAKLLIGKGADIKIIDDDERNLLHICSSSGRDDVVSLLISKGFDVNAKDKYGNTPVHYASMNDEPKTLSTLTEHGGNVRSGNNDKKTPSELAVENDGLKALVFLLNNGVGINDLNPDKKTLCTVAAESSSVPAMKLLIALGADCNKGDKSVNRPIHYAINYIESLKTLLEAGVNVEATGTDGKTPLEMTVDTLNRRAAMCLLKYGASPDQVRVIPDPGDRYYAYVKNPSITTRRDMYELIDKVKKGNVKAKDLDC